MNPTPSFEDFGFHPDILKGIRDMRYATPTPIQAQSIPPILEGRDMIANAMTGSGKTAAFMLPLMQRIIDKVTVGHTQILVLVPTRELACQIDDQVLGFAYHTSLKATAVYGGVRIESQEQALKSGTSIVVATPGRLLDHHKYGNWRFDKLEALVFDEADRMLDMGFWPDIQSIIQKIPTTRQTLLFSATMPGPIAEFAQKLMKDPIHIKIGEIKPPTNLKQWFYPVSRHLKEKLLVHLLKEMHMNSAIIFVGTKIGTQNLYKSLVRKGFKAGVIHGDLEQNERDQVIVDFKSGAVDLLVATDIASRGIHVDEISHVINYDMPPDADTYIHRIGRTARAEKEGDAISFVTHDDFEKMDEIEKAVNQTIPLQKIEGFLEEEGPDSRSSGGSQRHGGRPRSGGHSGSSGHSRPHRPSGPRGSGPSGPGHRRASH